MAKTEEEKTLDCIRSSKAGARYIFTKVFNYSGFT